MPDRTLIAAQGKVLALLAILLERAGVVEASEFSAMLSAFADLDGDPDQQAMSPRRHSRSRRASVLRRKGSSIPLLRR